MAKKSASKKARTGRSASKRPITGKGGGSGRQAKAPTQNRPKGGQRVAGKRTPSPAEARKGRTPSNTPLVELLFPQASQHRQRFGVGVVLAVAERQGDEGEIRYARLERFSSRPAQRPKAALLSVTDPTDMAKILTGLAHADRIRLAGAVMGGANTHHLLSKAVGLKTGPLYHHLRELERSGLLATVSRNRYELTELGRVALLITVVMASFCGEGHSPWRTKRLRPNRR